LSSLRSLRLKAILPAALMRGFSFAVDFYREI